MLRLNSLKKYKFLAQRNKPYLISFISIPVIIGCLITVNATESNDIKKDSNILIKQNEVGIDGNSKTFLPFPQENISLVKKGINKDRNPFAANYYFDNDNKLSEQRQNTNSNKQPLNIKLTGVALGENGLQAMIEIGSYEEIVETGSVIDDSYQVQDITFYPATIQISSESSNYRLRIAE